MFALLLSLALAADPIPEVLDAIDPDGDSSITDAEFAAGCKALAALNKSQKKEDNALVEKLDQDGDGKLGNEEILQLAANARESSDHIGSRAGQHFELFDANQDGVVNRSDIALVNVNLAAGEAALIDKYLSYDMDKDGNTTKYEAIANADVIFSRFRKPPSSRNPQVWQRAAQTIQRLGGADKRISKLEVDKQKELGQAFDEIDADADEQIKLIELFNWMVAHGSSEKSAEPLREVLDAIDPDGDNSITDVEFTKGCKAMSAIAKSKKKQDQALIERLDQDGDGVLSDEEVLRLAADARVNTDFITKQIVNSFKNADQDKDGGIDRKESASSIGKNLIQDVMWDRIRKTDANKDGTVTILELIAQADLTDVSNYRERDYHPSKRNPQMWSSAVQTMQKLGGPDKRINKLEAGKDKNLHAKFDEIDADKDERLKVVEIFNWMVAQ